VGFIKKRTYVLINSEINGASGMEGYLFGRWWMEGKKLERRHVRFSKDINIILKQSTILNLFKLNEN